MWASVVWFVCHFILGLVYRDESTGRDAKCQAPFFPIFAVEVVASSYLVCAKESCSFGYVQGMSKFMQENFRKQMETLQDLI